MNPPQWPGQPGYPPGPPHGPGFLGNPPPPPKSDGGGKAILALLFGGGFLVLVLIIGVIVIVASSDDDDDDRVPPIAVPTSTTPTTTYSPFSTPTTSTTTGGGAIDPRDVLKSTIRTYKGNTFTQVGTRIDSCTARANSTMLERLRLHPCNGQMYSAVYANPSRTIVTVISVVNLNSPSDASAVSRAVYSKGWPRLLKPSAGSGMPQLSREPGSWTRAWTLNSSVIYAQSYWAKGGSAGDRGGPVFNTAGELGVEVTNALRFSN
ncbi:hypothetical protein Arub01_35270 [Actinomadura rubrobrunea]|uniref:Uncharacterized protein n=1 Tax=Actinomadura rubrobrunea TaxID=115335 RepID=A0A9W6UWQ4_9ACTN|nr:hypothetical protein [Actinomadura rubrobrunea]GLW65283.1 hypothetical protein Arub01_35270 [Actinomadura rubrobrunea]